MKSLQYVDNKRVGKIDKVFTKKGRFLNPFFTVFYSGRKKAAQKYCFFMKYTNKLCISGILHGYKRKIVSTKTTYIQCFLVCLSGGFK